MESRPPRHAAELRTEGPSTRSTLKGQVTAIETGVLTLEAVFLPFMLGADGRPLLDRAIELLPRPEEKVVALPRQ